MHKFLAAGFALLGLATALVAAEPKKLLVVSASTGARHASIPNGEKMLRELAAKSNGEFTVTMMSDAADYPFSRTPGGGRGPVPGFAGQMPNAAPAVQDALYAAGTAIMPLVNAANTARNDLNTTALTQPTAIPGKVEALAAAESALAQGRASAIAQLQSSPNPLTPQQLQALAGAPAGGGRGGRGGGGGGGGGAGGRGGAADSAATVAKLFQEHLSPAALAKYDGVIFLSATGVLPFPDRAAFLKWVSDGKAVVGLHATLDTSYFAPDDYTELWTGGSRYASSPGGHATARSIYKVDTTHPATKEWPDGLAVVDEFMQFHHASSRESSVSITGLDRSKVHSLLDASVDGQRVAVSWTKLHGRGRVFYTSLGHRDDVMLPGVPAADDNMKRNADAISAAYQAHVLNGIRWALGLAEGSTELGNAR